MNAPATTTEDLLWKKILAKSVHDIRTPLSGMQTTLEVLRMIGPDSENQAKLIDILNRQVSEISEQLQKLLNAPESFAEQAPDDLSI